MQNINSNLLTHKTEEDIAIEKIATAFHVTENEVLLEICNAIKKINHSPNSKHPVGIREVVLAFGAMV